MKTSLKVAAILVIVASNCHGFRLNSYQSLLSARQSLLSGESCEGRCGAANDPDRSCQCNTKCSQFNDCCDDYKDKCGGGDGSCTGRCNQSYDSHEPCQCNSACSSHGDCCSDYNDQCGGSGGGVSDQDLKDLSEKLFAMSRPDVLGKVSLNTQSNTEACGPDKAPYKVFQVEDEAALLEIETVSKLIPLFDNYIPDQKKTEDVTPEESQEVDDFMASIMATPEMNMAYELLHSKGVFQNNYDDFSAHVKKLWFGIFNRGGGTRSSSGFEHVFVGETTDNGRTVGGQHNWVRLYLLEQQDTIQYKGYIDHEEFSPANSTSVYGFTQVYDWNGAHKCIGGGMVASVPELEMALATVCYKTRANHPCTLTFDGREFNYKTFPMHYDGYDYINTAYPEY